MMGNSELSPEVDANSLNLLLSQNVVDELLSKYMSTLTVSSNNSKIPSYECMATRALVLKVLYFHRRKMQ